MLSYDFIIRFFEQVYIARNFDYAKNYLSDDYICHCSAGTKNKAQSLSLLKDFLKHYPVFRITFSDVYSDENNVSLSVFLEYTRKEKFLGITVSENNDFIEFFKTFRLENGMIIESWGDHDEEDIKNKTFWKI